MGKSRALSLPRSFGSDYSAGMSQIIYKIVPEALWREAERNGRFTGAPIDIADGFIHFSTAAQVRETAAKHFAGQTGLLLIAIDGERLGDALKYEVSRGGALFPHLYAPLDLDAVLWVKPLPPGAGGHDFPALEGE
ncbi:DUF952 domain-containing protein [Mesorhizobium sp. M2A.F.Ca.ET.042.01.1.1]|nr:DUF952 domain-containing protein [Mesorhizobium sp. M2A.F.Ca.ET.042.01.1.1]